MNHAFLCKMLENTFEFKLDEAISSNIAITTCVMPIIKEFHLRCSENTDISLNQSVLVGILRVCVWI